MMIGGRTKEKAPVNSNIAHILNSQKLALTCMGGLNVQVVEGSGCPTEVTLTGRWCVFDVVQRCATPCAKRRGAAPMGVAGAKSHSNGAREDGGQLHDKGEERGRPTTPAET